MEQLAELEQLGQLAQRLKSVRGLFCRYERRARWGQSHGRIR